MEQSRRDDLEAIGICIVYFMKGKLPWQGLSGKNKREKYDRIKEKKISTSIKTLCEGLPEVVLKYFEYVTNLKFEDKPDYQYCYKLFRDHMASHALEMDIYFDWLLKKMGTFISPKEYADYDVLAEGSYSTVKQRQKKMSMKQVVKRAPEANLLT